MSDRPYVILSCAMSVDGYLDGVTDRRLILSNEADLDRVDEVRSRCDAILVGAATVRNDDPSLTVRDPGRVARRVAAGAAPTPTKVTVTSSAKLDPDVRFFHTGRGEKVVYCDSGTVDDARHVLGDVATVIDAGHPVRIRHVAADLGSRGVRTLLVEGGGTIHTQFLTAGLVDELQLVVAPFFVGDSRGRRFVDDGSFPWNADHRAILHETRQIGDVVLLRYALSSQFVPEGMSA